MKKLKFAAEDAVRAIPGNDREVSCDDGVVLYVESEDGQEMALVAHADSSKEEWFMCSDLEPVTYADVRLDDLNKGDRFISRSHGSWIYDGKDDVHHGIRANGQRRSFTEQTALVAK